MQDPRRWVADHRNGLLAAGGLALVSLLWGSSFVVIKIAARSFGPVGIASWRVAIAAVCLCAVTIARGSRLPRDGGTVTRLVALSLVGQILPFVSLGVSGHLTSSQNSAMMMGAVPLFTLLIGRFFLPEEGWSWGKWGALAVGFLGVLLALGGAVEASPISGRPLSGDLTGSLFALLAAVGYAAGAVLSRQASKDMSPLAASAFTMTVSAGLLWGYALVSGASPVTTDAGAWGAIIFLGTVNTAMAYGVYFWLVKVAGATFSSLNNYIVPVIGLFLGALVLSEPFEARTVLGLLLILLGVSLFARAR